MSRSGTPTRSNAIRGSQMVTLTLAPDVLARLDELARARGQTRSGAVAAMVRRARLG